MSGWQQPHGLAFSKNSISQVEGASCGCRWGILNAGGGRGRDLVGFVSNSTTPGRAKALVFRLSLKALHTLMASLAGRGRGLLRGDNTASELLIQAEPRRGCRHAGRTARKDNMRRHAPVRGFVRAARRPVQRL